MRYFFFWTFENCVAAAASNVREVRVVGRGKGGARGVAMRGGALADRKCTARDAVARTTAAAAYCAAGGMNVYIHIYTYMHIYVCMHMYVYVCICRYTNVYIYVNIGIYIGIHLYEYMYVHIYVYIHI